MPLGGRLKDHEIAELVTWVKMGAPWPETGQRFPPDVMKTEYRITAEQKAFWAFQPIHEAPVPVVRDTSWPKSPIDHFILAKLEAQGLSPVGPASKRVLIRRAYFDLIGLPPTPEEVDAFLRDSSPDAFGKIVDQLLASPHYGERWGRYWLDVARYAEEDVRFPSQEFYKNAWRYRDWVIKAFNDDISYPLFVKAQIAGDLLGEKDGEKLIAGTGLFGLGPWYYDNADPAQARADERHDRVDTLTRGFLGLTVACARCHNHKYDPISMKDYYALAGVFASSDYREYPLEQESVVSEYKNHQKKVKDQEKAIEEFLQTEGLQLAGNEASKTSRYILAAWKILEAPKVQPSMVAEEEKLDQETLERWLRYLSNPRKDHPYLKAWFDLLAHDSSRDEVRRVADEFQTSVVSVMTEKKAIDEENRILLTQNKPKDDVSATVLPNGFVDFCPGCYIAIRPIERSKFLLWNDLFGEKDETDDSNKNIGIFRYQGKTLDLRMTDEATTHLRAMREDLEVLKKGAPVEYPYLHGLGESHRPSDLRLHLRGSPYNLGEAVPRRFLAVLSDGEPVPFKMGSGRLELAEAIIGHPLTTRVIVNRIWKCHFGNGIVRTPSNFGKMGSGPSHPELLEYLASRFIKNGMSIKALHREIMLSSTYQLSSDFSERNFSQDQDNRLFWRASRRRLDSEALRDSLLYVSGNLDSTVGGPSVDLTDQCKRRTVYSKISRFKLSGFLELFDFPDPSSTSEQRNVTNVPLQRLFFLNSDLIMHQAESLIGRLNVERGADDVEKIKKAYRLLFAREATDTEVQMGLDFLRENQTSFAGSPTAWQQYAQVLFGSNEFSFVN
jgi:hypothetical protein